MAIGVYRQVAEQCFPRASIVVDRFHVERMANDALEKVRKTVRKAVSTRQRLKLEDDRFLLLSRLERLTATEQVVCGDWFSAFPLLGAAHAAKEGFAAIYECRTREVAERAFDNWRNGLAGDIAPFFRELVLAVENRRRDVFNYFDHHRITNAYTESINSLIKLMNRMGRGYSFEVLRARMLYDQRARKDGSTSIRRRTRKGSQSSTIGLFTTGKPTTTRNADYVEEIVEYGPYIPTLIELLKRGHFD